jgi:hypothetical protein
MAIAVTAVAATGQAYRSWTVTAADADTATSFTHGLLTTPDAIRFEPAVTFASTATPSFGATANTTSIFFVKSNTAGSGGLTAGTTVIGRIVAVLPHSLSQ